jgi:hypothetical protein
MLTVKVLSPDKTVMGEVDGVYGPAGNSPLYVRGTVGKPGVTEKTNINLYHSENPVYSPKVGRTLSQSIGHGIKLKTQT